MGRRWRLWLLCGLLGLGLRRGRLLLIGRGRLRLFGRLRRGGCLGLRFRLGLLVLALRRLLLLLFGLLLVAFVSRLLFLLWLFGRGRFRLRLGSGLFGGRLRLGLRRGRFYRRRLLFGRLLLVLARRRLFGLLGRSRFRLRRSGGLLGRCLGFGLRRGGRLLGWRLGFRLRRGLLFGGGLFFGVPLLVLLFGRLFFRLSLRLLLGQDLRLLLVARLGELERLLAVGG